MRPGKCTQHLLLQQNQIRKILEQRASLSCYLEGKFLLWKGAVFLRQKVKKKKKQWKYAKCFSWCLRRIQACSHSRPAPGAGGAESTCGWPTCSEQGEQWLSLTACDYKFFSAQAAHTKTLKLQQEKGQSKPSSPAYYNKSLVPACVLALITVVQADENKNNSGHSKINPNLIPPRWLLKIRTVGDIVLICRDWNVTLWISWDAQESPLHIPKGKKKKYSPYLRFWKLSILAHMPTGVNAFVGSAFAGCVCQLYPGPLTQSPVGGTQRGWSGCNSRGTHRFCTGEGNGREEKGRAERSSLQPPLRGSDQCLWRIGCQSSHTLQGKADIPAREMKEVYL